MEQEDQKNNIQEELPLRMGHKKLRTEKTCLNCGKHVEDRFCTHCGQENLELRDSAFHMVIHYVQDLFHYDGKLWHTLSNLFRRPGRVPADYMDGKRKQNLEPIRFYVFASTVYFITMFFLIGEIEIGETEYNENFEKRIYHLKQEREAANPLSDTLLLDSIIQHVATASGDTTILKSFPDSIKKVSENLEVEPLEDTTGWIGKRINQRIEQIAEERSRGEMNTSTKLINDIVHKLPQLLFISLPVFAFLLFIFYFKGRRRYYVDHFIFSTYFYAYIYSLLLFLQLILYGLDSLSGTDFVTAKALLITGTIVYILVYLYISMKRFYQESGMLTFLKYSMIMFLFFIAMIVLAVLFFLVLFIM